jgi:predicted RNA binding protein with dsRBD fold (UPF0201 family)
MGRLHLKSPIQLEVGAQVNQSESSIKVIDAVTNVIDRCLPEFKFGRVVCTSNDCESLNTIHDQIASRSIQNVVRRILIKNRDGDTTWFLLNKQAATVGAVVIIEHNEESPLGPISVTIRCGDMDALINWLTSVQ